MTHKRNMVVVMVAMLTGLMMLVGSASAQINTVVTFDEFAANTPISTQYADQGIIFGGNNPSIISDVLPNGVAELVLAPNNGLLFEGTITGTFVDPSDGTTPIVVDSFSLDAGAFNYIGTTQLQWFDPDGNVLGSALNSIGIDETINPSQLGIETFTVTGGNIASWQISLFALGDDGAFDRYAIDNVTFNIDECSLVVVPDGANCNAPNAVNDVAQTVQNTPLIIDVLDNDTDPDGDDLFVTVVTTSDNGGATAIQVDDTILYTPPTDFFGVDTFTYSVSDGDNTDSATVTVSVSTVTASNEPPIAVDDSATVDQNDSVTIDVLANDSDPNGDDLEITLVSVPENGSALIVGDSISYTPGTDFSGDDSFTYTISDGSLTATATVDVTVNSVVVNDAPIAVADLASGSENSPVIIDVLTNDSDPNGDALTVTAVTDPTNGAVVINADNTVTYTPDADYVGVDTFTYTISDTGDLTDTANVTVTVNGVIELATLNISKVTTPAESVLPWDFTVSDVNQSQIAAFTLDTNPNDATFAVVETLTLEPGTYTVSETNLPDDWDLTDIYCDDGAIFQADEAAATLTVTLTEGSETNCTFENERQPEIRVVKYEDANNNGLRDPGEIGLSGVTITVSAMIDGPEPSVAQQVTDTMGTAIFSNLVPNTVYTVCETVPEGYVNTQPGTIPNELGQVCQDILVSYGEIIPVYFGNYLVPADTPDLACLTFQPDAQSVWYEETPHFVLQVGNCDTGVDPYEAITVDALVCQIPAGIQVDTETSFASGYFTNFTTQSSDIGQVLTFTNLQAPNADDGVLPIGQFFNVSFRGDISEAPLSSQLLCTLTVNGNQDDDATFDLTIRTPENPNPVTEETPEEPVEELTVEVVEPETTEETVVVDPTPNTPFNALSVCWVEDQNDATSVWQVTNPNDAPLVQGESTKVMFDWAAYTVDDDTETVVQSAVRYDQTGEVQVNTALADKLVVRYYLWDNGSMGTVTVIEALADDSNRCEGLPETTPEAESTVQPETTEVVPEPEVTVPEATVEPETDTDVETETAPQPDPEPETTPEAEVTEPAPEATEESQ